MVSTLTKQNKTKQKQNKNKTKTKQIYQYLNEKRYEINKLENETITRES